MQAASATAMTTPSCIRARGRFVVTQVKCLCAELALVLKFTRPPTCRLPPLLNPPPNLPQAQQGAMMAEKGEQKQELRLVGPKPQRFVVAKGQLLEIASAAFPALMRLGSGVFTAGYSGELQLLPTAGAAHAGLPAASETVCRHVLLLCCRL